MTDVLQRKFDWSVDDIAEARELISSFSQRVVTTETFDCAERGVREQWGASCVAVAAVGVTDYDSGLSFFRNRPQGCKLRLTPRFRVPFERAGQLVSD